MVKKVIRTCISEPLLLELNETAKKLKMSRSQLIEKAILEGLPKVKEKAKVTEEKRYSYDDEEFDEEFLEWCRSVGIEV